MMSRSNEEWDLEKVRDLQASHRPGEPVLVQQVLLSMPALAPRKAVGLRISDRFERYVAAAAAPGLQKAIVWKVARAIEEGRIEESRIEAIFPRLENVFNRGAYFVACCKAAFLACGLAWHEEEWSDV